MPGNRSCAVAACPSPQNVHYHTFPVRNVEACRKWVEACRRSADHVNVKNARVCANHFRPQDYEPDLRAILMPHIKPKKRLKQGVVPSLKLSPTAGPAPAAAAAVPTAVKDEASDGFKIEVDDEGWAQSKNEFIMEELLLEGELKGFLPDLFQGHKRGGPPRRGRGGRRGVVRGGRSSRGRGRQGVEVVKVGDAQPAAAGRLNQEELAFPAGSDAPFSGGDHVPSPSLAQKAVVRPLGGGRRTDRWSDEAIVNGLVVRSISPRCFRRFRLHTDHPAVPPLRTLRSWVKGYRAAPGIQRDRLSEQSGALQSEGKSRLAYLTYDEVVVRLGRRKGTATTASTTQELAEERPDPHLMPSASSTEASARGGAPSRKIRVALLKGIGDNWHFPIYVDFDGAVEKKLPLLKELISVAEGSQIQVWALVVDFASNRDLFSTFDSEGESGAKQQYSLKNPADPARSVFCLSNVQQLPKLLKTRIFALQSSV